MPRRTLRGLDVHHLFPWARLPSNGVRRDKESYSLEGGKEKTNSELERKSLIIAGKTPEY